MLSHNVFQCIFQSFEDLLHQGKTIYFWKDGIIDQGLQDGKYGRAAYELHKNGKGVDSNEASQEALKTDAGVCIYKIVLIICDIAYAFNVYFTDAAIIANLLQFRGHEDKIQYVKLQELAPNRDGIGLTKGSGKY